MVAGSYRKRLVMMFAYTGATASMGFLFVWPRVYLLGAALVIIGVVCLGSSFVLLNSFLPLLAANHPSVRGPQADQADTLDSTYDRSGTPPNPHRKPAMDKLATSPELKLSTTISSQGVGLGYAAAVSVQILSILLLVALKKAHFASESTPLRCILLLVGVCWAILTIPGALWLKGRPGPSLPAQSARSSRWVRAVRYLTFAWGALWNTIKTAGKLRQLWVFLIAWFLLSDSIVSILMGITLHDCPRHVLTFIPSALRQQ